MSRHLVVDATRCVLSGECIYNHPGHFSWSDDGSTSVPSGSALASDDDLRHAEQATSVCPAGAISIVDDPE